MFLGKLLPAACLFGFLWLVPVSAEQQQSSPPEAAQAAAGDGSCATAVALLQEQDKKLSRDLRQIKRDIALLNQNLEEPGVKDIMAGIGYIFGLFGVAAYVASRRKP